MSEYREQWAGWRRIAVDKKSAANHRWQLDYKITFTSLEDNFGRPFIVPTIGLRKDGHVGKPAEGSDDRVIAGYYDNDTEQWVFLRALQETVQLSDGQWVQGPNPTYEVQIYSSSRQLIDASGWAELEHAMQDFVSRTDYGYKHHNPMDWFDVVDKQSSSTRVVPEGYGSWA